MGQQQTIRTTDGRLGGAMIEEKNGRPTCSRCGYEWSAMMGENELPDKCDCEEQEVGT